MAEATDVDNVLREWAPVSDLLNRIPTKAQNGIFNYDICLTCIDILPEYIAVGTNIGLVYWYDRKKKDLQKLRCENPNGKITIVKVISTVDYMVACGNSDGQVSIFQIPKTHSESLPESLKPKLKQVERYTVSELHSSAITSLEWSKNGMKLFSGDQNGLIVLTEIDFYMHLSKSLDILNEAYEVIQLNYCQQHLLVSTIYRTIVCKKEDTWKVCQVGKKDRKTLGKLGAIFWQNSLKPKDLAIYCTRPGLRIWVSDLEGTVQKTLLFKDLLNKECYEVPLINPITGYAKKLKPLKEATFGVLLPFSDNLLVTYSSEVIYILDPANLLVIATISHLRRILSVAVHKDEIFVLEGERSIVRISFHPEPILTDVMDTGSMVTSSTFLPLANSIKEFTNKIQTSSIISALPPLFETTNPSDLLKVHTDSTTVISAEEALELPPMKKLSTNINLKITENSPLHVKHDVNTGIECRDSPQHVKKWDNKDKISEEDFDDRILFKHRRRKKREPFNENGSEIMNRSVTSLSSTSSDEIDANVNINKPCLLNVSTIDALMPDLRSPDTILNDIEKKEKMLADILQLDKIKFSTFENQVTTTTTTSACINEPSIESSKITPTRVNPFSTAPVVNGDDFNVKQKPTLTSEKIKNNSVSVETRKSSDSLLLNNSTNNIGSSVILKKCDNEQSNNLPTMTYGPPSGSSNPNSIDPPACLAVPNIWRLQEITINNPDANETSDSSLCDWEII